MSRRPARRRAPALAGEQLEELDAPDVIPDGSVLFASLRWAAPRDLPGVDGGVVPGRRFGVVGLYQVDHLRELCRPRCTCGWTTEGHGLVRREAVDRLDLYGRCSCYAEVGGVCRCGAEALHEVLLTHTRQHGATGLQLVRA